jgi:glyoxylase-like metal-dependent hydrolase (beta-lactamase superfamily II)
MKVSVIDTGFFKLDGGAMFGVVPKTIWEKLESPDDNNLCTWAMRCLLVQTDNRNIIIDTGLGNKQSDKFFSHYEPHGEANLVGSLQSKGLNPEDITDVFLTHLHFDHVGGAVRKINEELIPTFPKATYWSNEKHWNWAVNPNAREKASFLKENFQPLQDQKVLEYIDVEDYNKTISFAKNFEVVYTYGHTEAMMLPLLEINGKKILYCADLIPSPSHISLPFVMGYDVRPLQTMIEKEFILKKAFEENWILFFEHSKNVEACNLRKEENGRISANQKGNLIDFV